MLESLNLTVVIVTIVLVAGLMYFFKARTKLDENSARTIKNKVKNLEEENDQLTKLCNKWKSRYFNLERQIEEGFDLQGDTSNENGLIGIVTQFLPMIAEKFPQAKGFLDNPELLKILTDSLMKHPDLLKNIVPALLGKGKTAMKKASEATGNDQKPDYTIIG